MHGVEHEHVCRQLDTNHGHFGEAEGALGEDVQLVVPRVPDIRNYGAVRAVNQQLPDVYLFLHARSGMARCRWGERGLWCGCCANIDVCTAPDDIIKCTASAPSQGTQYAHEGLQVALCGIEIIHELTTQKSARTELALLLLACICVMAFPIILQASSHISPSHVGLLQHLQDIPIDN